LRHVTAVVAACLAIFAMLTARAAAEWPDKPVRVVVPYVAGGANDLLGRVFAEQLSKSFGQQFFVENRTGGGGLIGTEAVARSAADGYTLIVSGMPSHVLAPVMNANASFDPIKDFTHIAYLGGPPNVFVVHPSLGVNSFKELLALMKSQTDGVQYVSPSIGSAAGVRCSRQMRRSFGSARRSTKPAVCKRSTRRAIVIGSTSTIAAISFCERPG